MYGIWDVSEQMTDKRKSIAIVTSALNEEDCLPEFFRRLEFVFEMNRNYEWSIWICDNGSKDRTWEVISDYALLNDRTFGFKLSRTFHLDEAITCGLDHCKTDAVIIMASDLQDPPEIIPEFLKGWEEGFDQVVVKVVKRNSVSPLRRLLSRVFYKFANKLSDGVIPEGVSDYRLISKSVSESISQMKERNRFLRAMIAWTGFKTKVIEIERPDRFAGESKFAAANLFRIIKWAFINILSFTSKPLHWISFIGLISSVFSAITTFILALFWFAKGVPFVGYGTIVSIIILGFSLVVLSLGVVAQYVGLIFDEVKQRPSYFISENTQSRGNK